MNLFGIGGPELFLILTIMLIVAGPKRMIRWSYVLGTWVSKARDLWTETARYLQSEVDAAGLDIEVPKDMPTRGNINKQIRSSVNKTLSPVTQPIEETLNQARAESKQIRDGVTAAGSAKASTNGSTATKTPLAEDQPDTTATDITSSEDDESAFGTWGNTGTGE